MKTYTRRKFIRVALKQEARLDFDNIRYAPCRIKDLSLTGMFVMGPFSQKVGDECTIRFSQIGEASRFYFKASAKVVRTTDEGLAIEFISMPLDSYMLLQTTLLYEAVDPLEIGLQIPENCPFEITIDVSREENEKNSTKPFSSNADLERK